MCFYSQIGINQSLSYTFQLSFNNLVVADPEFGFIENVSRGKNFSYYRK